MTKPQFSPNAAVLGSATVSVALAGVSPANPCALVTTSDAEEVFGGTPKTAVETTALPKTSTWLRVGGFLALTTFLTGLCSAQTPPTNAPPVRRGFMGGGPADQPSPRLDTNSKLAHEQLLEKAKKGGIDIYFEGDSITRRWGCNDKAYANNLANWTSNFFGWNAADFGWGADRIENILWRLDNGELDGVNPKVIVVLAGINNVGGRPGGDAKVQDITKGIKAILDVCQQKAPNATIILTALFPRNDNMMVVPEIVRINENISQFADGKKIRYLNVNNKLADENGKLFDGMMNAMDKLHPTIKGYQVWADGLKSIFTELLGPPAATDHAPPPTGDPSATRPK